MDNEVVPMLAIYNPDKKVTLPQRCNFPAPLVINGAPYCGCQLPKDHDGQHEVKVKWGT